MPRRLTQAEITDREQRERHVEGMLYGAIPPGTYRLEHPREVDLHQAIVFAKTLKEAEEATARWREHINARRRKKDLPEIPVPGVETKVRLDPVHGRIPGMVPEADAFAPRAAINTNLTRRKAG